MKVFLCCAVSSICLAASSFAAFNIQLDAGALRSTPATSLPSGPPEASGAVLILITAGADGIFQTPLGLTPGNYVAGDDVLLSIQTDTLSARGFNMQGGRNEFTGVFNIVTAAPPAGQQIALMWFPAITYGQWMMGATPSAGQTFGFYNPKFYNIAQDNNPDGGDPWVVPSAGSQVNLNFFTSDTDLGGSQLPAEGYGSNFVVIPEPSTWALLVIGLAGVFFLRPRARTL